MGNPETVSLQGVNGQRLIVFVSVFKKITKGLIKAL